MVKNGKIEGVPGDLQNKEYLVPNEFILQALPLGVFCYFFMYHLAFFFFIRNECRTTLVFPSCQIKKLLSDYIERKQYSLKCVKLDVGCRLRSFIRWLYYLSCCLGQGLLLLSPYTLCKPLEVLCRLRITENGSLRFRVHLPQLLSFGFNLPQLLLLVVVALTFSGFSFLQSLASSINLCRFLR